MYRKPRRNLCKGLTLLLCLVVLLTSVHLGGAAALAEDSGTVNITVNYVYASNQSMVAQPYQAQITKGAAFHKTLELPRLLNYAIPTDRATGLGEGIVLDSTAGTLAIDLESVDADVTVTLYYVAGQAKYHVYHYFQNLEDDGYTLREPVVELVGDIDSYTEAVADAVPGFHCKGVPQTTIAADGTTVVEIYYDRDYYTVIFDVNGGINGPEPIYAKYGAAFRVADVRTPARAGYTFLGWGEPALSGEVEITGNITYTAQWLPNRGQADYTIVLWGQNANDDEYSYLSSHEAWGHVGEEVNWEGNPLISHVHTEECGKLICGKEAHTHSDACGLNCPHVHDLTCYGLSANASKTSPNDNTKWWNNSKPETYFARLGIENGCLYYDDENAALDSADYYYLRLNGAYYSLSETLFNKLKGQQLGKTDDGTSSNKDYYYKYSINPSGISCTHTHTDSCYACDRIEHTHSAACFASLDCKIDDTTPKHMSELHPGNDLWKYERSETVTVDADGSTVLNVYFTRREFSLHFRKANSNSDDYGSITARWGQNIDAEYKAVVAKAGSSFWSRNRDGSNPWTNYIGVMPTENATYYNYKRTGSGTSTMTYYSENLTGGYDVIFTVSFPGTNLVVSDEDRYEFEGFTYDHGTSNDSNCNGAKFYYNRNRYALEFYSASGNDPDKTEQVKYQTPLGAYNYTPTAKPDTVEPDAVFVGWYQNPECTGERFDLAAHVMPAHNVALYAKWVNGLYGVTTYTDETRRALYTYDGYTGIQENIEKYSLATEPTAPSRDGYVFVGWFYREDGVEKPFSFTMPITRDYELYPKFSEPQAVTYTVHYYKAGTTEKLADDRTNSVMIGTTVTERAKMGTDLNLVPAGQQNNYYPEKTSTSVIINQLEQEIIFYYSEATEVSYTVYYRDAQGNDLISPVTKTTSFVTVTEQYVTIPNYAPRQFQITQDLSSDAEQNKIIFIYDPTLSTLTIAKTGALDIDENQTFVFRIQGTDENTKTVDLIVTVHGNGRTTVSGLPVGAYIVTEQTDWSWRYTPEAGTQTVTVTPDGSAVTFANARTDGQWLNGDSYSVNEFQ